MQEKEEKIHQLDLKNKELMKLNSSAVSEAIKVTTFICQQNRCSLTFQWV